jgi:hypothetical protein
VLLEDQVEVPVGRVLKFFGVLSEGHFAQKVRVAQFCLDALHLLFFLGLHSSLSLSGGLPRRERLRLDGVVAGLLVAELLEDLGRVVLDLGRGLAEQLRVVGRTEFLDEAVCVLDALQLRQEGLALLEGVVLAHDDALPSLRLAKDELLDGVQFEEGVVEALAGLGLVDHALHLALVEVVLEEAGVAPDEVNVWWVFGFAVVEEHLGLEPCLSLVESQETRSYTLFRLTAGLIH